MKTTLSYIALTLLCLLLYLPGMINIPIVDRDEPHFAQASRQMAETGHYWQIQFQDQLRHLKPPGIYWLHAAALKIFGNAESSAVWPYRLVSAIGGWLAVLLTFAFARTIYSEKIALLGAALLASSLLLIIESHLIVTDAVLLTTMVLMQGALWKIYLAYRRNLPCNWKYPFYFWLGLSAGIVIKGITPLVAILTLTGLCLIDRNIRWLARLKPIWGLAFVLVLLGACFIPLSLASHSNFILDMIKGDVAPKLIGGQESHGMPPGYFLLILPLTFWPGSLLIFRTAVNAWQQRHCNSERFLLAWIIPSWVFFEIVPTKLPEYVLPLYPAIALLTALTVYHPNSIYLAKRFFRWIEAFQYLIWILCGALLAGGITFLPYYIEHRISPTAMIASIILFSTSLLAVFAALKKKLLPAMVTAIIGTTLTIGIILQWVLPTLKNLWISEKIATITSSQPLQPLLAIGYDEPSLVFLLGTHQVQMISPLQFQQSVPLYLKPPLWILVNHQQSSLIQNLVKNQNYCIITQVHNLTGFQYTKFHWVTLDLFTCQRKIHASKP